MQLSLDLKPFVTFCPYQVYFTAHTKVIFERALSLQVNFALEQVDILPMMDLESHY